MPGRTVRIGPCLRHRPAIWLSMACYVGVAVMWLVPDRRIERYLATAQRGREGGWR